MAASKTSAPRGRVLWLAMGVLALVGLVLAMVMSVERRDPKNVAVHSANGDGMDALLEGIVEVTSSCVAVSVGGETWTPVFPRGSTRLANDTLDWGGREFVSGDPITLGGGEASAVGDWIIPAGCPRTNLWVVTPH